MMRAAAAATVALVLATGARAAEPPAMKPASIEAMAACRRIAPAAEKADCYDRAFDQFETAQRNRDVMVVDRAEMARTRRALFGFTLPKINLFSRGESKAEAAAFETLETSVKAASQAGNGRWQLTLADDARWMQVDDEPMSRTPRNGDPIKIRKGAVGSFLANVAGQRAIRVRRLN